MAKVTILRPEGSHDYVKQGDLLLKYSDQSFTNKVIHWAQNKFQGNLLGGNSDIAHAAIAIDGKTVVEAQGEGLSKNNLLTDNKEYTYEVWRCTNSNVGLGAGTAAEVFYDIHTANDQSLKYNLKGAALSLFKNKGVTPRGEMDKIMDRMLAGHGVNFFCSEFATYCYQFSAEQNNVPASRLFNVSASSISPTKMRSILMNNPTNFKVIGFLDPARKFQL